MKKSIVVMFAVLLLCICGCSKEKTGKNGYEIYYMNTDNTRLDAELYYTNTEDTDALIQELLEQLESKPDNMDDYVVKDTNVDIMGYELSEGKLTLKFSEDYLDMEKVREVLCRTAYVRTLAQVPEIDYVTFYVADQPLMDSNNTPVGAMNAESFVENTGDQINAYESAELNLYFAGKSGKKLVRKTVNVVYSTNISMEKLILEQLIKGPGDSLEGAYPVIPEDTKLLGIYVQDGTCYVNVSEGFMRREYDVADKLPVYAIVNSLTELTNINSVQISVNGESNKKYGDSLSFDEVFERDMELVEGGKPVE